jgi:hypothetical protein
MKQSEQSSFLSSFCRQQSGTSDIKQSKQSKQNKASSDQAKQRGENRIVK